MSDDIEPTEMDTLINEELAEWDRVGLETSKVPVNGMILDTRVSALIKSLIDSGVIDHEKLNETYRETLLKTLKEQREALTPLVQRMRLTDGIIGPNGQPMP